MANVPLSGTGRTAKATDLPEKQSGKFFMRRVDSPNHPEAARIFVAFGATDYSRFGPTITSIALSRLLLPLASMRRLRSGPISRTRWRPATVASPADAGLILNHGT
jgi:hypothetical protein